MFILAVQTSNNNNNNSNGDYHDGDINESNGNKKVMIIDMILIVKIMSIKMTIRVNMILQ